MNHPDESPNVLRYLKASLGPVGDGPNDAELLHRFVAQRDQGAFELIVWRHAAMVLRVCRGVLRDFHAAEDATQATFLTLARKAGSISHRDAVAGWLYRVARRISFRLARQQGIAIVSNKLNEVPSHDSSDDDAVTLHEEVDRLPEKYRLPVLLCFFEGLSHEQAAQRLGWPVGTVAGRMARAKEQLHNRLQKRGLAVTSVALTTLIASDAVAVPNGFVTTTAAAGVLFSSGANTVPGIAPVVIKLSEGALSTMIVSKLQWAAAIIAVGGLTTLGGAWAIGSATSPNNGPIVVNNAHTPNEKPGTEALPLAPAPEERKADAAQRRRSLNNLKQILLAIHNYHDTYGHFPKDITDKNGTPLLSWRVAILPFMDQDQVFKKIKMDEPWDSDHNKKCLAEMPVSYRTAFQPKDATETYYQGFAGPGAMFEPGKKFGFARITDGTSNTIAVIEAGPSVPWMKPIDLPFDVNKPLPPMTGPFSDALHVSMGDGSAHAFKRGIDEKTFKNLIGTNDGYIIPELKTLYAALVATTEEEKKILLDKQAEFTAIIRDLRTVLNDHADLLEKRGLNTNDLLKAENEIDNIRMMIEEIKERNERLKGENSQKKKPSLPASKAAIKEPVKP